MKKDNSNGNKFEDAHAYGGSCCGDVCSVADPEMINAKADRDLVDAVVEATVERRQNAPAKIETGKDDTENILLFKTSTCPNCRAAEAVLRKSGVDYVEIYADDDKNRSLVDGFEIMQAVPGMPPMSAADNRRVPGWRILRQYLSPAARKFLEVFEKETTEPG